ncbi:MAG TPA: exostosin [Cyanobacteria bacterium UBA8553]|nr:exostosin [Cyanobacteria bacterium UBA8553]HAJ61310.1 exostosin [Cyanobacteria bacterium UBA8543]
MKLKLFCDPNYLSEGMPYESILYPFWGKPSENSDSPQSGMFDNYIEISSDLFEMSPLEEADLAIVPSNWEPILSCGVPNLSIQFVEKVKQAGKLSVSFFGGDCSHIELPIESDLVFRNSLYRSVRKSNDFAMPAGSEDFVKKYFDNQICIRKKQSKPVVGFCGFAAQNNLKTYIKLFLYKGKKFLLKDRLVIPPYNIGHVLRTQALPILSKDSRITTNFIQRERPVFFNEPDSTLIKKLRMEFVQNMVESDYMFCCRGSGNYSFRFYEALSCGRIPVFIDTDCVLPYDFEIDWKKYCVWLDESELPLIAEKIAEFHENLSPQEFVDLQHECRRVWEQRIAPEGFFANLHRHIPRVRYAQERKHPILTEVSTG